MIKPPSRTNCRANMTAFVRLLARAGLLSHQKKNEKFRSFSRRRLKKRKKEKKEAVRKQWKKDRGVAGQGAVKKAHCGKRTGKEQQLPSFCEKGDPTQLLNFVLLISRSSAAAHFSPLPQLGS